MAEEARLTASRVRLQAAIAELAMFVVAIHGAVPFAVAGSPSVKVDDEDATDKKAQRLLKRKLPSPKDDLKTEKVRRSSRFHIRICCFSSCSTYFGSCGE